MILSTLPRRLSFLAASAAAFMLAMTPLSLIGQVNGTVQREPSVNILAGDVFEIAGADGESLSWSWVLTRGGNFVEASRDRVFHVRLLEAGSYMLDLAVSDQATGMSARRLLPIEVQTRPLVPPTRPSSSDLVVSDPAKANNTVTLPTNRQILRLSPTDRATGRLTIDLNAALDADGDGDAANDDEAAGMLFATDGVPLHVWYPVLTVARPLVVRTADDVTVLTVTRDGAAPADTSGLPNLPLQAGEIAVNVRGNGEVTFAMPVQYDRQDVIIYRWDFGDGRSSLRDAPTHRYFRDGSYTVKAEAIDMRSGTVIITATRELTLTSQDLEPLPSTTSSSSRSSTSSSSSFASATSSASSSVVAGTTSSAASSAASATGGSWFSSTLLKTIGSLLLVGLLAIAAGLGLSWLAGAVLKRVRSARDTTDSNAGAPKVTADLSTPAPAISLRKSAPAETPPPAPKAEPAAAEPVIDIAAAPAWLKQGLEKAQSQPSPEAAPIAAEATPAPAPTPIPEPEPAPIAPTTAPAQPAADDDNDESMPPWLRAADKPLVAPAPSSTPTPAADVTPQPASQADPAPAAEPEPTAQEEENLPPWLRGGMDAPLAPAAPAQTPAPAVEPVATPTETPVPTPAPITETVPAVSPEPDPVVEEIATPAETVPATTPAEPTSVPAPVSATGDVYHEPDDQKSAEAIILDALEPPAHEEPVMQPVPAAVNDAATAAAAAMPPQPAPAPVETPVPVVEPVVTPAPVVQTVTEPAATATAAVPVPTDTQPTPTAVTPVVAPTADASTKTPEQLERERERRRKKRQRYRENQRKRAAEAKAVSTPGNATPNTTAQTAEMESVDVEEMEDGPVVTETFTVAPTPTPAGTPATTQAAMPAAPAPAPAPAITPSSEGPLSPSGDIAPAADDDKVAFVIRADSIAPPEEPKNDAEGAVGHP